MNIYELTGNYLELLEAVEDGDEEKIAELMAVDEELEEKAENYAKVIKCLEAEATAYETEAQRMLNRKKTIEGNIKRMKESLMNSMLATGKTKFKKGTFSFGVQKNGGKLPLVVTTRAENLPDELRVMEYKADSDALRKYIEETGDVTYGYLEDRGQHLSIR